ncbi:MAG: hypothetical protein ACRCW2_08880 [Cellulosilyticaceae bacterium]
MNYDTLVEDIVKELYQKLQGQSVIAHTNKKRAIISSSQQLPHEERLQSEYEIIRSSEGNPYGDLVIVPELDMGLLAKIALGIGDSKEVNIILEHLLRGKPVYALEQGIRYRQYKSTAHRTLYTVYSDYENKIKQYGVRFIHDVTEILTDQSMQYKHMMQTSEIEPEVTVGHEAIQLTSKKVILESDLTRGVIQGMTEVVIKKGAIITPLADDYIKAHHLVIKRI